MKQAIYLSCLTCVKFLEIQFYGKSRGGQEPQQKTPAHRLVYRTLG